MKADKFTVLVHPATGKQRKVKNGFSGTVFIFSFLALLVRRQFKIYVLEAIFGIHIPNSFDIAFGIGTSTALGIIANRLLLRQLLKQGYVTMD